MKVFALSVLLVLAVFLSESKGDPMAGYKMESYDNGNYKVMWKYDMIMDRFYFKVMVNATGWVGFGVSNEKGGMVGYDVMLGGVRNANDTYAKDYFTTAQSQPNQDTTQNYNLTSAMQMDGYTNLTFFRMRDTGDASQDVVIKTGPMYLIWAYHSTDDVEPNGSFNKHIQKGAVKYTFIDAEYTMVKINDNYRLYWKYDNATDMFYFTVVVKTTGWVAFAVSTRRGGMVGYDAMIGGVRSGVGYIGDYMTVATSRPPKDAQQDYTMTSSEERAGYTKLTFHRKRNTGDDKDIEIKAGQEMNIVWAYHATEDVADDGSFSQHTMRGGMPYTFNFNVMPTTTPTKGGSALYFPSLFGIIGLLLFQCVIGA